MNRLLPWLLAHPYECALALYAALNLLNALLPASARQHRVWGLAARVLDRLAVLTQRGDPRSLSWPLLGRTVVEASRDAALNHAPPRDPPRGQGGFVRGDVLGALAVFTAAVTLAVACHGCALMDAQACKALVWRMAEAAVRAAVASGGAADAGGAP